MSAKNTPTNNFSDYLSIIFDTIPDSIALIKIEKDKYSFLSANDNYFNLTGFNPKDIINKEIKNIFSQDEYLRMSKRYKDVIETKKSLKYIDKFSLPNGYLYLEGVVKPVIENEEVKYVLIIVHDITDLKNIEKELKKREEKYRMIAEHSTDVIIEMTPDTVCEYISPSVKYILGYSEEELLRNSLIDYIHERDKEHVLEILNQTINSDKIFDITCRTRQKNGEYIWTESTVRSIKDSDNKTPIKMIAVTRDVSKRKKIQDELMNYIIELEDLHQVVFGKLSSLSNIHKKIKKIKNT